MTESQQLLAEYAKTGSEAAFQELVARYLNLVYSTALRVVGGDPQLAEDVAQQVFVHLARKAPRLSPDAKLGGWLHRDAYHVAATMVRGERRRQQRERQAAEMNALQEHTPSNLAHLAPVLDEAIEQLGAEDRLAIVLRFFEQREFGALGQSLGITDEAARKRVGRALEKLQGLLKRRGVTLSAAALGTALATEAVTAAPAGLALSIAGTALASATGGLGTAATLFKVMSITKLQISVIGALVVAGVATPLVLQQQSQARLREANELLRQEVGRRSQLEAENARLSRLAAQASNPQPAADEAQRELLRLRGEVARLRTEAQALRQSKAASDQNEPVVRAALQAKDREAKLKQLMREMPNRSIPEFYLLGNRTVAEVAKDHDLETENGIRDAFFQLRFRAMNQFAVLLQPALKKYTDAHNGQPPEDLSQLAAYFDPPVESTLLQRYMVLPTKETKAGWSGGWVVTQKEPVDGVDARWFISPVGFGPGQFDSPAAPAN